MKNISDFLTACYFLTCSSTCPVVPSTTSHHSYKPEWPVLPSPGTAAERKKSREKEDQRGERRGKGRREEEEGEREKEGGRGGRKRREEEEGGKKEKQRREGEE